MHKSIKNLEDINSEIREKVKENIFPKIIAVSKTFKMPELLPLIEYGHLDFGENKVQEAIEKWQELKLSHPKINLHLIGKLQTNKVKLAVKLFDYIHSVDNEKLAKKISEEQLKQKRNIKIFIQVNFEEEEQKSGISVKDLENFYEFCIELNLEIVGLMCIPPQSKSPKSFFQEMNFLNKKLNLKELSMGMSSDYMVAVENRSTFLRIGSKIFGARKN